MRRNLVIVRAGDSSLHPRWLAGANRNWDLLVNYFGDDPLLHRRDDVIRLDSKGPKYPALRVLLATLSSATTTSGCPMTTSTAGRRTSIASSTSAAATICGWRSLP